MSSDASGVTRNGLRLGPPALLAAWLVGVDVWVKIVARLGACPGSAGSAEGTTSGFGPWSAPQSCSEIAIAGELALMPAVREGLPGVPLGDPLTRQLALLLVIATLTIATIVVLRARTRQSADALALGCAWAGGIIWAAPVLAGPGVGFTELVVPGLAFGIGDFAVVFGLLWLVIERVRA